MPETDLRIVADRSLRADLELLQAAAREAGRIAGRYFRRNPEVWYKDGKSPVSEADMAVDRFLKGELLAARPDFGWLSEETAEEPDQALRETYFVVDPIDGTRAFLKGLPTWCVSIAIVSEGRPVAGVLDCPEMDEVYLAAAQSGAHLNGRQISVGGPSTKPTVAGPDSMIDALPKGVRKGINRHPYIPSLAYRIAMVANGSIDATFVRPNAHDWDIAAAELVLQEAGGSIKMAGGNAPRYGLAGSRQGAMVAGSGDLLDRLHETIRG